MILDYSWAVAALGASAVLAPRERRTVLAAGAVGLGGSALHVALGGAGGDVAVQHLAALPPVALAIDAGLELAGGVLATIAALTAFRSRGLAHRAAGLLAAIAAGLALWMAVAPVRTVAAGAMLVAAGFVVLAELLVRSRSARSIGLKAVDVIPRRGRGAMIAVVLVASIAAVTASHVALLALAVLLALLGGRTLVAPGRAGGTAFMLLVVLPLGVAGWLIAAIAGPVGLSFAALRDGPFSPAAEALIVPFVALAGFALLGMRPVALVTPRALLAIAGAAVLIRVGGGLFPSGMAAWETVAMPLGVLALALAAVARDVIAAAAAMAWMGAFAGGGAAGAWWLAASASAASALYFVGDSTRSGRAAALRTAVAAAGAYGAARALGPVLGTEVLYGVMGWIACVAAAFRARG